jgi:ankyrin repeat protein
MTQLYHFCFKGMTSSVMRMLEMRSIDVEAKRKVEHGGDTCLTIAVFNNRLDICRFLINKGAHVHDKNRDADTTLHLAARQGHIEIVRLLCDHGADIEARNKDEWRPLHYAAHIGHISIVKELIEVRNAEINARTNHGATALKWAGYRGKGDVVAYLISHGAIGF